MQIRITTLGSVTVSTGEETFTPLLQQPIRLALLVYLALERRVSRDELLRTFWPDSGQERGRQVLNQNLYRLRQSLRTDWVVNAGGVIQVLENVHTDVADMRDAIERKDFAVAVKLWRGPFLHDVSPPSAPEIERWVTRWRLQLEGWHRKAQRGLIDEHLQRGDTPGALRAARGWAEADPLEDEAHHRAVELMYRAGHRSEALAHFERYRERLRLELEVEPLDETVALVERIRAAGQVATPSSSALPLATFGALPDPAPPPLPARSRRWAAAAVALAAAAALATLAWRGTARRETAGEALDPTRVAVLYFEDQSTDGSLAPVATGITEGLIRELGSIATVRVVSAQGASRYRRPDVSVDSIARALRAGSVVRGSVQASRGQLRVTFHLVDATGEAGIQSGLVQRDTAELFRLQDELTDSVARVLRTRLGSRVQLQSRLAERPDRGAYLLVQRAVSLQDSLWVPGTTRLRGSTREALLTLAVADSLLRGAEERDPDWSEPAVLRGWALRRRAWLAGEADTARFNGTMRRALASAERALRRDGGDARALELRGTLRRELARVNNRAPGAEEMRRRAEADLRRAVGLEPSLATAWATLSRLRLSVGDVDGAAVFARRALAEDPFLLDGDEIALWLFRAYRDGERFDRAGEWCARGRRDYPGRWEFTECELALGAEDPRARMPPDSAAGLLARLAVLDPPRPGERPRYQPLYRAMLYAQVLTRVGRADSARAVYRRAEGQAGRDFTLVLPFALDASYLQLMWGDTARALALVERYVRGNPQSREYVANDFALRGLRGHPRYQAIVRASPGPR